MGRRIAAAVSVCLLVSARTGAAAGPETDVVPQQRDDSTTMHGMAEFGVGTLLLPDATVCTAEGAPCKRGDASLALSGWPLFRRGQFAGGAGITMGLTSSTSTPANDSPDVPRAHLRRYLSAEATARYYLPIDERIDAWTGVTAGLGVVNDTFLSTRGLGDKAVVGPRGATILTEGFTCGIGLGAAYAIAENWRLGFQARGMLWFLPDTPATDTRMDLASLTGHVVALDLALTIGYRTRLVF